MHRGVAGAGGHVSEREQGQAAQGSSSRRRGPGPTWAWARTPPARLVRSGIQYGALVPLLRFIAPFTVIGKRNLAKLKGPAVFVANHQSHFDAPVCLAALGGRIRRRLVVPGPADPARRRLQRPGPPGRGRGGRGADGGQGLGGGVGRPVPRNPFANPLFLPVFWRVMLLIVAGLAAVLLSQRRSLEVWRRSTLF